MNELVLVVDENSGGPPVSAHCGPAEARPVCHPPTHRGFDQIIFLDTLARDIRAAVALLEQATPRVRRQPGWYVRLGDVGGALAMIDEAGLLPRTKPAWYLRLQEFAGAGTAKIN